MTQAHPKSAPMSAPGSIARRFPGTVAGLDEGSHVSRPLPAGSGGAGPIPPDSQQQHERRMVSMRGLHGWVKSAALAAIALSVSSAVALAAGTMTFRPMSADSVKALEAKTPAAGHGTQIDVDLPDKHDPHRRVQVHIDSSGATIRLPGGLVSSDSSKDDDEDAAKASASSGSSSSSADEGGSRETTSDIVRLGSDVTVAANQVVEGDVVSMGGSVKVDGTVRGSVTSMGGDVTLGPGARVDRDVVCVGGILHEAPGSSIGGQRVTGRMPGSHFLFPMMSVVGTGVKVMYLFSLMLVMLGIAYLFVKLAPGRTQAAIDMIQEESAGSFLVGLLLWGLVIPSVVVLALGVAVLCITIIGIPLALAVMLAYAAFLVLAAVWGGIVGYAVLGGLLHLRFNGHAASLMRSAVWGIVAVYGLRIMGALLHIVPLFGFFGGFMKVIAVVGMFVLGTLGAGALVRAEYRRRTVQDWWQRSRPGRGTARAAEDAFPPPPPPPVPAAPPVAPAPLEAFAPVPPPAPAPAPPSPPEAFRPPTAPEPPASEPPTPPTIV